MTVPLAELSDLAAQLQVDVSAIDATAGDLILAEASAIIRAYCRWNVAPSAVNTVTLDSDGGTLLRLPCLHVTAVTTVTLDDGSPITDYAWSDNGLLARSQPSSNCGLFGPSVSRWPLGFRRVTITYTGGYDTVPAELKAVALLVASRSYINPTGLTSETIGGYSYSRGTARGGGGAALTPLQLTTNEMRILDRYKLANPA